MENFEEKVWRSMRAMELRSIMSAVTHAFEIGLLIYISVRVS